MFKKNVYYCLILLCLFSGGVYAVPPTIQNIVNEVQQAQDLVTSVKSKLTIVNDVSTATLTASALLPALDSENDFVYSKPDNIIMSSYKAVGYLHTTTTVNVNYDKMHMDCTPGTGHLC